MTFAELLSDYIGYRALNEVSAALEEKGFKADPSYLSRLRTGKRPAPDDEGLVSALAQVCGKDPQPLMLLAKLEREPHETFTAILERAIYALEISNRLTAQLSRLIQVQGAPLRVMNALHSLAKANKDAQERFGSMLKLIGADYDPSRISSSEIDLMSAIAPAKRDLIEALASAYGIPADGLERVVEAMRFTVEATQKPDGTGGGSIGETTE